MNDGEEELCSFFFSFFFKRFVVTTFDLIYTVTCTTPK